MSLIENRKEVFMLNQHNLGNTYTSDTPFRTTDQIDIPEYDTFGFVQLPSRYFKATAKFGQLTTKREEATHQTTALTDKLTGITRHHETPHDRGIKVLSGWRLPSLCSSSPSGMHPNSFLFYNKATEQVGDAKEATFEHEACNRRNVSYILEASSYDNQKICYKPSSVKEESANNIKYSFKKSSTKHVTSSAEHAPYNIYFRGTVPWKRSSFTWRKDKELSTVVTSDVLPDALSQPNKFFPTSLRPQFNVPSPSQLTMRTEATRCTKDVTALRKDVLTRLADASQNRSVLTHYSSVKHTEEAKLCSVSDRRSPISSWSSGLKGESIGQLMLPSLSKRPAIVSKISVIHETTNVNTSASHAMVGNVLADTPNLLTAVSSNFGNRRLVRNEKPDTHAHLQAIISAKGTLSANPVKKWADVLKKDQGRSSPLARPHQRAVDPTQSIMSNNVLNLPLISNLTVLCSNSQQVNTNNAALSLSYSAITTPAKHGNQLKVKTAGKTVKKPYTAGQTRNISKEPSMLKKSNMKSKFKKKAIVKPRAMMALCSQCKDNNLTHANNSSTKHKTKTTMEIETDQSMTQLSGVTSEKSKNKQCLSKPTGKCSSVRQPKPEDLGKHPATGSQPKRSRTLAGEAFLAKAPVQCKTKRLQKNKKLKKQGHENFPKGRRSSHVSLLSITTEDEEKMLVAKWAELRFLSTPISGKLTQFPTELQETCCNKKKKAGKQTNKRTQKNAGKKRKKQVVNKNVSGKSCTTK